METLGICLFAAIVCVGFIWYTNESRKLDERRVDAQRQADDARRLNAVDFAHSKAPAANEQNTLKIAKKYLAFIERAEIPDSDTPAPPRSINSMSEEELEILAEAVAMGD